MSLVFYNNPMSRARIAHWMLEETGQIYEAVLIDTNKDQQKDPRYLEINPMGKVPAIVHDGTVITEAAAICTYLADAFPQANLAPAVNSPERGTYLRWLYFGAGCLEPALIDKMFSRPMPDAKGALGYGSYKDTLNALEKAITPGPYILGDQFSAADVYIASQIDWGLMTKSLEPRPAFLNYVQPLKERPAFKRFNAAADKMWAKLKANA